MVRVLQRSSRPTCRFKKLDLDNNGSLSVEEFMSLPELQQNPLVQRVIGEGGRYKTSPTRLTEFQFS